MKIRNWLTNKRTYLLMCMAVAFVCYIPVFSDLITGANYYGYASKTMVNISEKRESIRFIGEMNKKCIAEQTFVCKYDTVSSIVLYGATYVRTNHGKVHVELLDEDKNNQLEAWDIDASTVGDHSSITLQSKNAKKNTGLRGDKCKITITSDSSEGDAITLGYVEGNPYPDGQLLVNGNEINGDFSMTISGYDGVGTYNQIRPRLSFYLMIALELLLLWFRYQAMRKWKSQVRGQEEQA